MGSNSPELLSLGLTVQTAGCGWLIEQGVESGLHCQEADKYHLVRFKTKHTGHLILYTFL